MEVRKYVDPNRTTSFGIVVVPDSVYEVAYDARVQVLKMNVVLVAHGMLLPYLLLVFQTVLQCSQDVDVEKLGMYPESAERAVTTMQNELDGRFSKAITMLTNARSQLGVLVAQLQSVWPVCGSALVLARTEMQSPARTVRRCSAQVRTS